MYVPSWTRGTPAAFDIAITSPHRTDVLVEASVAPGAAAELYENYKRRYKDTARDCASQGIAFIPIVGEPSGGWGPAALCAFKALARAIASQTGRDPGVILSEHRQALCVALRQANARAIFRRTPVTLELCDGAALSAQVALAAI